MLSKNNIKLILIIHPKKKEIETLENIILKENFTLLPSCETVSKCAEILNKTRPHLIIISTRLKTTIDGFTLSEHIYNRYYIPSILIAEKIINADLKKLKHSPTNQILQNPINPSCLITAIHLSIHHNKALKNHYQSLSHSILKLQRH